MYEKKSTDCNAKKKQMLGLFDKNFKATIIIKMFQEAIINFVGTNERQNLSKEIKLILKKHMRITELKNTVSTENALVVGSLAEWR